MVLIVRVSSVSDGTESAKYQRIFLNGLQTEGCGVKKKKQKARPAAEVREKLPPAGEETLPPKKRSSRLWQRVRPSRRKKKAANKPKNFRSFRQSQPRNRRRRTPPPKKQTRKPPSPNGRSRHGNAGRRGGKRRLGRRKRCRRKNIRSGSWCTASPTSAADRQSGYPDNGSGPQDA